MSKPLPYAPVYLNDLLGECLAEGLGFRERGILLSLLHVQHVSGAIPADLRAIKRRLGGDARLTEIRVVVDLFFPITDDGAPRVNREHAKARAAAESAYQARVRGGQSRAAQAAAQRRGEGSSASSSANSSGGSNQNQSLPPHPSHPNRHPAARSVDERARATRRSQNARADA
jgi:hypothetical protein